MTQLDDARRKWQKDGAGEHLARCFALLDRMDATQVIATNGSGAWTRFDPNIQATRSGNTSTNTARRAKGRKMQDEREYGLRLKILEQDWGLSEGQVLALYAQQGNESFDPESFDPDSMPEAAEMPRAHASASHSTTGPAGMGSGDAAASRAVCRAESGGQVTALDLFPCARMLAVGFQPG